MMKMHQSKRFASEIDFKIKLIVTLISLVIHCHGSPVDGVDDSVKSHAHRSETVDPVSSSSSFSSSSSQLALSRPFDVDAANHKIPDFIARQYPHSIANAHSSDKHESHHSQIHVDSESDAAASLSPASSSSVSSAASSNHCINPDDLPNIAARSPDVLSSALKLFAEINGREKVDSLIRNSLMHFEGDADDDKVTTGNESEEEVVDDASPEKHSLISEELTDLPSSTLLRAKGNDNLDSSSEEIQSESPHLRLIDIPVNFKSDMSKSLSPLSHVTASDNSNEDVQVLDHPMRNSPPHRNFLVIPRMRTMPFGSRVKVIARNKVLLELKIPVIPYMSAYDALKQAENRFHITSKMNSKWIEVTPLPAVDSNLECFAIHRIGRVTDDASHHWNLRVISANGSLVYEGQCIPDETSVIIRPNSVIELILTPSKLDR